MCFKLVLVLFVVGLAVAQLDIAGHMLVANSSYNRGVLSVSMSYTGSQPYNLTILNEETIEFLPQQNGISIKHTGRLQVNTLFTSFDESGYWITIKILNKPKSFFEDFLPAELNGYHVLIPTMQFPLHLLGAPLRPFSNNPEAQLVVFQVNYKVRSIVAYGRKLGKEIVLHWGDSKHSEATLPESDGARNVFWDDTSSSYKLSQNSWGKGWRALMPTSTFAKAVRPVATTNQPQIISISIDNVLFSFYAYHQPFGSASPSPIDFLTEQLHRKSQQL